MNLLVGSFLILASLILLAVYRPKGRDARLACALCALAGVFGLLSAPASLGFEIAHGIVAAVLLICGVLECRRDAFRRRLKRAAVVPPRQHASPVRNTRHTLPGKDSRSVSPVRAA